MLNFRMHLRIKIMFIEKAKYNIQEKMCDVFFKTLFLDE